MGPDSIITYCTIFVITIDLGRKTRMNKGYHIYFSIIVAVEFGELDDVKIIL